MNHEISNPDAGVHYFPDGTSRGSDALWQENSAELGVKPPRVAYSGNPGFTTGGAPITAETSLFRFIDPQDTSLDRVALQEALRAVNLYAPDSVSETPVGQVEEDAISTEIALQGLGWLIPQIKRGDPLRRAATRARAHLEPKYDAAIETRRQQAQLQEQTPPADSMLAENLQWENQQAGYRQELAAAIKQHAATTPETFHYDALSALSEELVLEETENGLVAQEKPRYQRKLEQITNGYLEKPAQFFQDLRAVTALKLFASKSQSQEESGHNPAFLLTDKVLASIIDSAIAGKTYAAEDLTNDTVSAWLDFADSMGEGIGVAERVANRRGFSMGSDEELSLFTLATGEGILIQSLANIAAYQPRSLIDSMYRLAETGLDQERSVKHAATLCILEKALETERDVGVIMTYSVGAEGYPAIQQKALDLQLSLLALGVSGQLLYPGSPATSKENLRVMRTSSDDLNRLSHKLYPSVLCVKTPRQRRIMMTQAPQLYRGWRAEFTKFVQTPEGQATTLFGRVFGPDSHEYRQLLSFS